MRFLQKLQKHLQVEGGELLDDYKAEIAKLKGEPQRSQSDSRATPQQPLPLTSQLEQKAADHLGMQLLAKHFNMTPGNSIS